MRQGLRQRLLARARALDGGQLLHARDVLDAGGEQAVYKALSRLCADGELERVTPGAYRLPVRDESVRLLQHYWQATLPRTR